MPTTPAHTRRLCAALAAAGFALVAAPALAQTVEEITVMGRVGADGRPQTLSRVIDVSDLDLRGQPGIQALHMRIRNTARDLCRELGETGGATGVLRSCEDMAVTSAMGQARFAIASARTPDTYAYVAPAGPVTYAEADAAPGALSATESGSFASTTVPDATYTMTTVTNGPVPDTAQNRARFGGPMSNGGRRTAPVGN
jgi:UrcA family protein